MNRWRLNEPREAEAMVEPHIQSVQTGGATDRIDGQGRTWRSAINKSPIDRPVWISHQGLDGDEQADQKVHGGPDKAVCVYVGDHYAYWTARLGRSLASGAFGENLTITGLDEATCCIGDIYAIGDAVVQVSQPRGPCWKLGRQLGSRDVPMWVQQTRLTGWYARVVDPGLVAATDRIIRLERPRPTWPILEVNRVRYERGADEERQELAEVPELADAFRAILRRRFRDSVDPIDHRRLYDN